MLPRDEQTFCSLSRHRSSAGGVVWAQQCSWLWQAALGRCRPADISRVLYVPLFSLGKPARVVLPWPGEEFMPDLPSTLGCHCCSSSWVPVGKCAFGFLEGSERGHTGSPSSASQGSWKARSWWMLRPFYGAVCPLHWLACIWFTLKRRRNPSLSCTPFLFLPGCHHLLLAPPVFCKLWVARLGQTTSPVVLSLLPLLHALVRALERENHCLSTQQWLGTSVQAKE